MKEFDNEFVDLDKGFDVIDGRNESVVAHFETYKEAAAKVAENSVWYIRYFAKKPADAKPDKTK